MKETFGAEPPFPISLAVRAGGFVFASGTGDHGFTPGEVIFDHDGFVLDDSKSREKRSIEEQTRGTIENIRSELALAGCTLEDIVDVTVYLKRPSDFMRFNKAYGEYFTENCPARTIVCAHFVYDCDIEMKAVAYKLGGSSC